MKKRIIMSAALVVTLATLTGCNSKTEKLTCTKSYDDNGFKKEEKFEFDLKKNKVSKAKSTTSIIAEGDYSKNLETYKNDAQQAADAYSSHSGMSAKVEQSSNKVSLIIDFEPGKLSEDDASTYNVNESYESLKDIYTEEGYTCK